MCVILLYLSFVFFFLDESGSERSFFPRLSTSLLPTFLSLVSIHSLAHARFFPSLSFSFTGKDRKILENIRLFYSPTFTSSDH